MNFSEQSAQNTLPQFSEIASRTNVTTSNYTSNRNNSVQSNQNAIYTTANELHSAKQILINSPNKYSSTILNWPDPNALMQFCEKQGFQTINIPAYSQNSTVLSVQSHNLPMRIIPNVYVPQTDNNLDKNDISHLKNGSETNCSTINSQTLQQQSLVMAEYLQKLQSSSLPLTLQQLIKIQSEQVKKEKDDEQKNDQIQNILNIPSVPIYKSLQNDTQYLHNDHSIVPLNPSDVNVHIEEQSENTTQGQTQTNKIEQTIQIDVSKPEKKIKFRAKTGEIKITIALDGSTLYCCPECNLAFAQKSEIDLHLQIHVQERKYQCKECGAMLKRKEHLDQHMRGHSDERPFKCPVCQKAFKRNEHLTRHYVIHSGDKNFSCQVCQKAFSRKDHLNKHTQTHLGIKKTKSKRDIVELTSNDTTTSMLLRPDINNFFKEGNLKQDTTHFLQHIQNLQKDSNLMQTFSAFKEHVLKDGSSTLQQQAVNMNEILPQNTRYLMPS
ncbi:PREDICTED: zinc finger protein with KRAB and SCAN domains 5-like [Ceratosolen solmsi marchali]|uniref:Zinc finger protein with KRAB and SCAN domains 5-like n=1 Tax=Ceratosolen solmsi marchali TaxID=326594 RepID=A0AAJ6YFC9_9HYME|nr:PREDICTED: zinc finger protein with KRAB and SCAN domains 5-like [Ceratosolen solmsi marchali]